MQASKVMKKLKEGKPVLSTKINFNDPGIVEMVGLLGFDCIWLCREHRWLNDESIAGMILAARSTGTDTLVRIERDNYTSAIKPLEMGAKGIMIPHVLNAGQAKEIVNAMKFYPVGRRGVDGANADSGWMSMGFKKYLEFSNKETFLVLQIEDPEAVDNLEEIASVPGYEMLFVGPGDLSTLMGFSGDIDRREIWDILEKVVKAANKYGKFSGTISISPEWTERLLDLGYLFVNSGADITALREYYVRLKNEYKKLGF